MVYDLIIIGAGASGLFAAKTASELKLKVAIFEAMPKPGTKLSACGGGVGNLTNTSIEPKRDYYSQNPFFAISTLKSFPQQKILDMLEQSHIGFHLRDANCYFTNKRASDVANFLYHTAEENGADFFFQSQIKTVLKTQEGVFVITTSQQTSFTAKNLLIATGGKSYTALGGNDFGLHIAQQFSHSIIPPKTALAPFTFSLKTLNDLDDLSGIALPKVGITIDKKTFVGSLVFRPDGLGGIAVFKAQAHWQFHGGDVQVNWIEGIDFRAWFDQAKKEQGTMLFKNKLTQILPKRLAYGLTWVYPFSQKQLAQLSKTEIEQLQRLLTQWTFTPEKRERWEEAEVMLGGVDTHDISSKTLESNLCKGLYFSGEVLDVTGQLGGYNLHWAFASGERVAKAIAQSV